MLSEWWQTYPWTPRITVKLRLLQAQFRQLAGPDPA